MNVVKGSLAPASVNVEKALAIGKTQLYKFQESPPGGYNVSIERKVKTMVVIKKGIAVSPKVL